MRFKIIEGSESRHCCFRFTIVDTTQPVMIGDEHFDGEFESVCECFSSANASMICEALNACNSEED